MTKADKEAQARRDSYLRELHKDLSVINVTEMIAEYYNLDIDTAFATFMRTIVFDALVQETIPLYQLSKFEIFEEVKKELSGDFENLFTTLSLC